MKSEMKERVNRIVALLDAKKTIEDELYYKLEALRSYKDDDEELGEIITDSENEMEEQATLLLRKKLDELKYE